MKVNKLAKSKAMVTKKPTIKKAATPRSCSAAARPASQEASNNFDVSTWPIKRMIGMDNAVRFTSINKETIEAGNQGKYLFIWDRLGTVHTFYKFRGQLCEFDQQI